MKRSGFSKAGLGTLSALFEVYPRVMYGLESIEGWDRILAVVPKDYRTLMDSAKAQTDFWINIVFLGNIFICEYVMFIILYHFGINLFFYPPRDHRTECIRLLEG